MDWERLGRFAKDRRLELARTQGEVAQLGGLGSLGTIRRIESGKSVKELSLAKLDHGLDWRPGSAARVLAGGYPEDAVDSQPSAPRPPTRVEAAEHVRRLRGDEAADALAQLAEPWFWIEYGRFVADDQP
ncbi:helix-turn-helix domain-containing protein [Tenggerimyces flavus]|uniref:Helix-turn-helix domain-containing protein n=1 Tax=Tenggerimyces flavus TaxID=1708749 RepID=A0ABV7YDF9_9ACTN|nr:hypothetical protein [Tenggerimyces flavus]MBM7788901.1 transcriptional regulator with XRE-family HTH domain [Tenggerimyces flavus]